MRNRKKYREKAWQNPRQEMEKEIWHAKAGQKDEKTKPKKQPPLEHFLVQFGVVGIDKGSGMIFVQDDKYFLLPSQLVEYAKRKKFFYAGLYLGKSKGKKFFPSINLLNLIKDRTKNKIWIDKKTEWLFVCGRDIFASGIRRTSLTTGSPIALVLNQNNEVLGFGKMGEDLKEKGVVVKNILDIGDFLRREK